MSDTGNEFEDYLLSFKREICYELDQSFADGNSSVAPETVGRDVNNESRSENCAADNIPSRSQVRKNAKSTSRRSVKKTIKTEEEVDDVEDGKDVEEINNEEGGDDATDYQTVTLVQSDVNQSGEVSYMLIVAPDNTNNDYDNSRNGNEPGADMSVFDFVEDVHSGKKEPRAAGGTTKIKGAGKVYDTADQAVSGGPVRRGRPRKDGGSAYVNQSQANAPTLMCNYCNYTSTKRFLLLRHMKSHSEERPHKCNICVDRAFKTVVALNNHLNTHSGVKPHKCKECDSAFTTCGELIRHVRYRHTYEKPHKCIECDYASVELSKLKRHIRSHTGERPYQCPHCVYASPDTFKLKRHLRVHSGEKPYECEFCQMRFTQSNSLKSHRLIHTGEKPVFHCELCPTTCGRKTDLRNHVLKIHTSDKPLLCRKCGKSFPDRYTYKIHVRTHGTEKCFKCELCPYAAHYQNQIEAHILLHAGEKPYRCRQCAATFGQKQLLQRHIVLHHGEGRESVERGPYSCDQCERMFKHKGNLKRHVVLAHEGKDPVVIAPQPDDESEELEQQLTGTELSEVYPDYALQPAAAEDDDTTSPDGGEEEQRIYLQLDEQQIITEPVRRLSDQNNSSSTMNNADTVKRPRGRPRKSYTTSNDVNFKPGRKSAVSGGRKRGRPRSPHKAQATRRRDDDVDDVDESDEGDDRNNGGEEEEDGFEDESPVVDTSGDQLPMTDNEDESLPYQQQQQRTTKRTKRISRSPIKLESYEFYM